MQPERKPSTARRNQLSVEEIEQNVATAREYLKAWKSILDKLGIWVIEPDVRLFDSIAFSLLNKAYRLSESCLVLVEQGRCDEAYGLSRSIFECAVNLRYLTLDRESIAARSNNYLDFFHAERKHFLGLLRESTKDEKDLAEIEAKARAEGVDTLWRHQKPSHIPDWKTIEDREWNAWKVINSSHPLDDELNPRCEIRRFYVVFWRDSSAMVHCSIRSLDNNFAVGRFPFKVAEQTEVHFDHSFEPILIVVFCLYLAVRYTLFGINHDGVEGFDSLLEETSRKLNYRKLARTGHAGGSDAADV